MYAPLFIFLFIYVHGMPKYKLLCVGCAKDFLLL